MSGIRTSRLSDRQKAEVLRQKIRNAAEELAQLDGSVNPREIDRLLNVTIRRPVREPKCAAEETLDEIATLCGCPEWDYPGQVIRDVKSVAEQRTALLAALKAALPLVKYAIEVAGGFPPDLSVLAQVEAAIAKAEGKTKP